MCGPDGGAMIIQLEVPLVSSVARLIRAQWRMYKKGVMMEMVGNG